MPTETRASTARIWAVGALCRAVADSLEARFNPVAVRGEVSGFTRAASGHCYFSLKDEHGQLRCAMFRRAAGLLDFAPRDGDQVELRGRLTVYEARGDLQLVVESMRRAGQGQRMEQFLQLKARLQAEGLFEPARKRALPLMPRGIGVVTSPGAAALHDVLTALRRRVPHIPVLLAPALVQGAGAPASLVDALSKLYLMSEDGQRPGADSTLHEGRIAGAPIDVILLVRGGGSIEDLWAFNDEQLARTLARSPVPVVCGVGHETDFTIADFVADLRAPTPTAAAELVCAPQAQWLAHVDEQAEQLARALRRRLDDAAQRLDAVTLRLTRPAARLGHERLRLQQHAQRLQLAPARQLERAHATLAWLAERLPRGVPPQLAGERDRLARQGERLPAALGQQLRSQADRLERAALRLHALDPARVLERGYAWLQDEQRRPITRADAMQPGQPVTATLSDGKVDLTVVARHSG